MTYKRFTSFIEDNGYWIRDESNFKIIATGLKFGVSENLIAYLNGLNDDKNELQARNERQRTELDKLFHLIEQKDWETLTGIVEDLKRCYE
jgi:hypothetical protein